ncbi:MFS transporter [Chloroflexota bacterium]
MAAFFIMVVNHGVGSSFGVFFKPLLADLRWTRAMTSGAFSFAKVVQGLSSIVIGRLTDRFGPRMVMTLCGILLGLGYLLMSQTSAPWQLYLFYGVIIGSGMGGSFIPLTSTVARWFVERRSMMTGIVLAGMGTGILIGAPVAARLISAYDWRVSYIILGSTVLVLIASASQLLRRDPTQVGQRPYGESKDEESRSVLATQFFTLREAVHTRQFWLLCSSFFCYAFCHFAIVVHIVPHITDLGFSATTAAYILATIGGGSIIGKVVLGSAADRIGNRLAMIIGFIFLSAALFWLVPATEVWMLYLIAGVMGFAQGGCSTTQSPLVATLFGLGSHGVILGALSPSFNMGAAAGPFLAGYVFDFTGSYQVAFLVCAAIGVVGLLSTALLTPTKTRLVEFT